MKINVQRNDNTKTLDKWCVYLNDAIVLRFMTRTLARKAAQALRKADEQQIRLFLREIAEQEPWNVVA